MINNEEEEEEGKGRSAKRPRKRLKIQIFPTVVALLSLQSISSAFERGHCRGVMIFIPFAGMRMR